MAYQDYIYALWGVRTLLCACLLFLCASRGIAVFAPAFSLYITWEVGSSLGCGAVILVFGFDTFAYGVFYEAAGLLTYALLILSVREIFGLLPETDGKWPWVVMLVTGLFLASHLPSNRDSLFDLTRLLRAVLLHVGLYYMLALILRLLKQRRFRLGGNLTGILWLVILSISTQYLLFTAQLLGGLAYSLLRWLIQPSLTVGIVVALYYFRRFDPPVAVHEQNFCKGGT